MNEALKELLFKINSSITLAEEARDKLRDLLEQKVQNPNKLCECGCHDTQNLCGKCYGSSNFYQNHNFFNKKVEQSKK